MYIKETGYGDEGGVPLAQGQVQIWAVVKTTMNPRAV
jgi:hypothetical protein